MSQHVLPVQTPVSFLSQRGDGAGQTQFCRPLHSGGRDLSSKQGLKVDSHGRLHNPEAPWTCAWLLLSAEGTELVSLALARRRPKPVRFIRWASPLRPSRSHAVFGHSHNGPGAATQGADMHLGSCWASPRRRTERRPSHQGGSPGSRKARVLVVQRQLCWTSDMI